MEYDAKQNANCQNHDSAAYFVVPDDPGRIPRDEQD